MSSDNIILASEVKEPYAHDNNYPIILLNSGTGKSTIVVPDIRPMIFRLFQGSFALIWVSSLLGLLGLSGLVTNV